jgi:excisionase family DNA binding protein
MNDPFDEYIDAVDASSRLGIHPESVKRLIRQGKIPARKVANKWFIQRDVLEQFATRYDPRPGRKATLL